jgi:hypothetical protein
MQAALEPPGVSSRIHIQAPVTPSETPGEKLEDSRAVLEGVTG